MADVVTAVAAWEGLAAFQTIYPQSAVALDKEGFVYAAYPFFNNGLDKLNGWSNITAIANGSSYVAGLRADGSVLVDNYNYYGSLDTSDWQDIVAISASTSLIGLKEDGTVIATGLNDYGEGNVEDWKDIIAISTSRFCTLGLKRDGTVVAVGNNPYGAMDIKDWSDIVAIQAGDYFSIGLKADGSMVLAGDSKDSGVVSPDVSNMKKLYVPSIEKIE
jgi:alpha-tubulin suppressor-like RCC1 family protein